VVEFCSTVQGLSAHLLFFPLLKVIATTTKKQQIPTTDI